MIASKSYYKILEAIYINSEIRLNELIRKSSISVETAKARLDELLETGIIKEKRLKSGKKTIIRNFYPNLESEEGLIAFSLVELEKKNGFFIKNTKLIGPFKELIKELKEIEIVLIFGSFASFSQTEDSDLDLLLLTTNRYNKERIKKTIERSFVTFDHEVSPRVELIKNFKKNALYDSIKKNHIVVKGILRYIKNFQD